MPICDITPTVPVTIVDGQVEAPDITVEDVNTGDVVCVTWTPEDGIELQAIVGLPSSVRVTGPNSSGQMKGTYFSPEEEVTWDYYIVAINPEGIRIWHDPKIENKPTPTRRAKGRSAPQPARGKASKPSAKPAKSAKPAARSKKGR